MSSHATLARRLHSALQCWRCADSIIVLTTKRNVAGQMSEDESSQLQEQRLGAVLVHGGRRYRRAPCKTGIEEREKGPLERGGVHSAAQLLPLPFPPPQPVMNRRIHPAELIRSPTVTFEASPFQRFQPLPAIGSKPVSSPHSQRAADYHASSTVATVSVVVRLQDGSRCDLTLPVSSPLSSLVARARGVHPSHSTDGWSLCTSEVPKRELNNLSLSLQEAGITFPSILHLVPPP